MCLECSLYWNLRKIASIDRYADSYFYSEFEVHLLHSPPYSGAIYPHLPGLGEKLDIHFIRYWFSPIVAKKEVGIFYALPSN